MKSSAARSEETQGVSRGVVDAALRSALLGYYYIVLVLVATAVVAVAAADVARAGENVVVNADVVILVYDNSGKLDPEELDFILDTSIASEHVVRCGEAAISYRPRLTVVEASSISMRELVEWLSSHYERRQPPRWLEEEAKKLGVADRIAWVSFAEFTRFLYGLVERELLRRGIHADSVVVLIGDIDGYSRQYYFRAGPVEDNGFAGWACLWGCRIAFYDLTVVVRERPEPWQPFYGMGEAVSAESLPPIMLLSPSDAVRAAAFLVGNHVVYHLVPWCTRLAPVREIVAEILFVDLGRGSELYDGFNASLFRELVSSMVPWAKVEVKLRLVQPDDIPGLRDLVAESRSGGWLVFEYVLLSRVLLEAAPCKPGVFTFYVLATERPSHMMFSDSIVFNFTGFQLACFGATSYPGYGYRAERLGLERVVAHELGHYMGLIHPFEAPGKGLVWAMDWCQTVMSYDDLAPSPTRYAGGLDGYAAYRAAIAAVMASSNSYARLLLAAGSPLSAALVALNRAEGPRGVGLEAPLIDIPA